MWSGGKEENNNGEAVLLFQPITSKSSNSTNKINNSNESYIGGCPSYFPNDEYVSNNTNLICDKCGNHLSHIAQINAPLEHLDRTLYVFGCNSYICCKQLQTNDEEFHNENDFVRFWNGNGVFRCIRSQCKTNNTTTTISSKNNESNSNDWDTEISNTKKDNDNQWDGSDDESDGGWGVTTDERYDDESDDEQITSMKELEAMVNAHEINEFNNKETLKKKQNTSITTKDENEIISNLNNSKSPCLPNSSFPQYKLELFDEPYASSEYNSDSDDDDDKKQNVGTKNDHELQSMLQRYLKEDQDLDPQIANLLQSKTTSHETKSNAKNDMSQTHSNNDGEKYERLPLDQRILMSFMERIKRAPNQVVRYAYGGEPLWSAPTTRTKELKHKKKQIKKGKSSSPIVTSILPEISKCPCGTERTFEFQIVSSTLHVLNVDHYTYNSRCLNNEKKNVLEDNGGMNWGVIAIYSCPVSCDHSREEFVIVQASIDDVPSFQMKRSDSMDNDSDNDSEEH